MKYLTNFSSEQSAKDYSKECRDMVQNPTMTIEYMFSHIKHSTRTEWALIIPSGWEQYLKQADVSNLIDRLDDTWRSAPEQISNFQKYRVFWAEFAAELIAEFNALNSQVSGSAALNILNKLSPVLTALNGLALGVARDLLTQIPVDASFPQEAKDYFLNKLNTYLSQW